MKNAVQDRFAVYAAYSEEVASLSRKLQYPVDDILTAVQEVGFNEEAVEEYIRDRHNRY